MKKKTNFIARNNLFSIAIGGKYTIVTFSDELGVIVVLLSFSYRTVFLVGIACNVIIGFLPLLHLQSFVCKTHNC